MREGLKNKMDKKEKDKYKLKAEILKSIAHPLRLAILDLLKNKERNVEEIIKILNEKQSTISKHLAVLKKAGIVDDKKIGLYRFYYLKIPCVFNFSICVSQTLKEKIKLEKKLVM